MSDIALRIEGLGKRYRIGADQSSNGIHRYKSLRDSLVGIARRPLAAVRNTIIREPMDESNSFWALKDIDFDVKRGEVVGIIGRNGAGKSTLLKILSRITKPTVGHVALYGRVGSLLEVGTGFHPELTGRENIYLNGAVLGMTGGEVKAKFDEIVAFSEIEKFLDTPVKHYSSGMYMRLAFAVAAHLNPEILVVDEVLAVGDAEFQKKCLGKMKDVAEGGRTILFVSHNMAAISRLCERGVLLDRGRVGLVGKIDQVVAAYKRGLPDSGGGVDAPKNVLYEAPQGTAGEFIITRIEGFHADGNPIETIRTWDDVVFRVHYRCTRLVQRGSVVLDLASEDGTKLLLLSTQPGGTLSLDLLPGNHAIDCRIEKFPFSAGRYLLGGGLAVPNVEWLFREPELTWITVHPRDVFDCGSPPTTAFGMVAPSHLWKVAF